MRSCGISLFWITSPFIAFAAGISLVLLLFSSTVIPLAANKSRGDSDHAHREKPPAAAVQLKQPWTRVGADGLMHVTSVSVGGELLGDDASLSVRSRLSTGRHDWKPTKPAIVTPRGRCTRGGADSFPLMERCRPTVFDRQAIALTLIPDDFTIWLSGDSELMTFHDIRAYTRRRHQQGSQAARLTTDYYSRIAFPFVTVIMVLVGIALSLRRSGTRGGSMAIGIGQALAVGFCYWTTHSIAIALGRGGALTASDRRLDGKRALHEFWPLSDVQSSLLADVKRARKTARSRPRMVRS